MSKSHSPNAMSKQSSGLFSDLTHAVPGFVWLSDAEGQVELVNKAWVNFTGLSQIQSAGTGWLQALHPDDIEKVQSIWTGQSDHTLHEVEIRCRKSDGTYRWHLLRANRVADGDGAWIGCTTDIHDHVMAQKKDRAQIAILNMIASGEPVQSVLEALCDLGDEQLPGCRSSVLMLNEVGTAFQSCAAPFLPQSLRDLLPGTMIGPAVGSCGTAAYEKRDVVSSDISTDPLWKDWHQFFTPLGIRACWSRPVFGSDGQVLASFGFYFLEVRSPNEEELANLDNLRHIAALVIERARTAQALRESEDHHRHTVEHNPQIPWTADPQGRLLTVSARWTETTGLSRQSALGNGWFKALHPDDVEATITYWAEKLRSGEDVDLKYRMRLRDGTYRWVRARAAARRDAEGRIIKWYGTVEDIQELELATDRLRRQAFEDDLTSLLNRKGFEEALRAKLNTASGNQTPVGLLLVDIDSFKHINNRHGHETGDAALRLFGRYLRICLDEHDIVARIAADDFAIVLDQPLDGSQLQQRANKLVGELNRRLVVSTKLRDCSCSIGCAVSAPGGTLQDLLRRANLALDAAKADARGSVRLFNPSIQRAVDDKNGQIDLAKQALKTHWIVPFYQPMVLLENGEVAGAEALLRVAHPADGILSPASIWAALDAPKVSKVINERMLKLVLTDLAGWKPWPTKLGSISVNLSTDMMLQDGLARSILRKLERKKILPQQLTVEITERVLIDELAEKTMRALAELSRHGVRISLDDFGTGYASLTHLQKLPLNEIKIDRSFIEGIAARGANMAIVKSMIGLGLNMGVDVVAEGVETAEQARLLRDWGCKFAQGYYFYKPMPGPSFALLHSRDRLIPSTPCRKSLRLGRPHQVGENR